MGSLNKTRIRNDGCKTLGEYVKAIDERLKRLEERTGRSGYTREDFYRDSTSSYQLRPYNSTRNKNSK